ncbi:MAG: hypothetical protein MJZ22_01700 [Candidatus Saccharibacteria bacterium]|nr:hypothetical protein [Candidatus Saccharibacteria bacterium]
MKYNRNLLSVAIIAFLGIFLALNFVSPTDAGPIGVLLMFMALFVLFFCIVSLLMDVFYKMSGKRKMMRGKDYFYAAIFAFAPVLLLMVRSFGRLTIMNVLLVAIFVILTTFLVHKKI